MAIEAEASASPGPATPLPMTIVGAGAVSPAGWGAEALSAAVSGGIPLPVTELTRTAGAPAVRSRRVPAPVEPPAHLRDARLRRSSPITSFAVAAAVEALGPERVSAVHSGALRLGIIFVAMNGCVNFSRRFYGEVLDDPRTASPLVFPETVFNAPSSHLAALLRSRHLNYTLVGDTSQFLAAFHLAAQWLEAGQMDIALVVGAEEFDGLSAEGATLLDRELIVAEGAAALCFEKSNPRIHLAGPALVHSTAGRAAAACSVRDRLLAAGAPSDNAVLFDSLSGARRSDAAEESAWAHWTGPRFSARTVLGDGLAAGAGWQAVAAAAHLQCHPSASALVCAAGANQQVVGALILPP